LVSLGFEVRFMRTFFQDVRFGIRTLLRKPGFTAAAVIALALGIGANTAIFSVVNGILLRPLPYPQQDRIMMIFEQNPQQNRTRGPFSTPDFNDLRALNRSFEKVAAYTNIGFTLIDDNGAEAMSGAAVSSEFFDVLGVKAQMGRTFQPGAQPAIAPHGDHQP